MKKLLFIPLLMGLSAFGQDTLKVMYHNVLKFPGPQPERVDSLRIILQYTQPDVYVVQELQTEAGADLILNDALNVYGEDKYQRATFIDGYDTDNGFFYNSDILGYVSQEQIGTPLRDISLYKMYYKGPNLSADDDTVYLHFFSCHLKAGSADYEQRNQEALQLKYYLNDIVNEVENVFVGGDFNFYSGFESGCQSLLNFGQVHLVDPVDAIGNWSNDFSFAMHHTQSTRMNSLSDGSGGGLDDRFDLILVSEDVMDNGNAISYVPNSYQAIGQDGNRFNASINSPANSSIPDSVSNALYYASDHLPVYMEVVFDEMATNSEADIKMISAYLDPTNHHLKFIETVDRLKVYNLIGEIVFNSSEKGISFDLTHLQAGVYIWQAEIKGSTISGKTILP